MDLPSQIEYIVYLLVMPIYCFNGYYRGNNVELYIAHRSNAIYHSL